jgi:acyl carrier protein
MSPDIVKRLEEIFRIIFAVEDGRDVTTVEKETEPHWDSFAHVSLVAAIEGEFGVTLEIADMEAITSFVTAHQLLQARGT